MGTHSARLSSAEIGGLWAAYLQETMAVCLLKYFLYHNRDEEIKVTLQEALEISVGHIQQITDMYNNEKMPLPDGFTDEDIDLSAPPLFYDLFGLTFVYSMSRMGMINTAFITSNIARQDILELFTSIVNDSTKLYQKTTALMLAKGVYDRPPMIPYPKEVKYIDDKSYISAFGKKRPLNTMELAEIFFNTERNYFSIILCLGLLQVVKDKEIHDYIQEGKKISEKQIRTFNDILIKEELLGNIPLSMEVTDSTVSPFSNKLIVMLFHSLNSIDITLIGHAMSVSLRTDLVAYYEKYILEILLYAKKGFKIMVDRGWMQEPPGAPDRRDLEGLV